jgi:hypothetical protein
MQSARRELVSNSELHFHFAPGRVMNAQVGFLKCILFLHFAAHPRTYRACDVPAGRHLKNAQIIAAPSPLNALNSPRKSDNMAAVSTSVKCIITLAVVFGILYVLISPLPEMDATYSGKSALSYFILVTHAFLGLFFLIFLVRFRPVAWIAAAHDHVLDMICVRLC